MWHQIKYEYKNTLIPKAPLFFFPGWYGRLSTNSLTPLFYQYSNYYTQQEFNHSWYTQAVQTTCWVDFHSGYTPTRHPVTSFHRLVSQSEIATALSWLTDTSSPKPDTPSKLILMSGNRRDRHYTSMSSSKSGFKLWKNVKKPEPSWLESATVLPSPLTGFQSAYKVHEFI